MRTKRTLCYCGVYSLNPENATYVKNGKPLCAAITCERVALRTQHPELYRAADDIRADPVPS